MKRERILVVDDEPAIRFALSRALSARGYEVEAAIDGEQALALSGSFRPDVVVLDLNLPDMDGVEVCRRIRSWSSVPIVVLSVREDESDKVEALDMGADDYLTKPFGVGELLARVRVQLRRAAAGSSREAPVFEHGRTRIDLGERRITRDGESVRLTRTEWALLESLASHPGKLLTHGWLLEDVWGPGYTEDLDVLRVFVSQLRKKIEEDPARPSMIITEPGVGYRWAVRPNEAAERTTAAVDASSS